MKKRTLLLTTLAVFTITFAGCGSATPNSTAKIPNNTSGNQMEASSPTGNNNASQTNSEGSISEDDTDIEDDFLNSSSDNSTSSIISQEEASKAVLSKVDGATEQNVRISFDTDDGRQVYEGEIHYNGMEYEFELNAKTGDILEWSKEREDD